MRGATPYHDLFNGISRFNDSLLISAEGMSYDKNEAFFVLQGRESNLWNLITPLVGVHFDVPYSLSFGSK